MPRGKEQQLPRHWLGREGGLEGPLTVFFLTYIFSHLLADTAYFTLYENFFKLIAGHKITLMKESGNLPSADTRKPSFTHVGIGWRCRTIPAKRGLLDKDLDSIQNVCEDGGCRADVAEREILRSVALECALTVSWIEISRWLKLTTNKCDTVSFVVPARVWKAECGLVLLWQMQKECVIQIRQKT